MERCKNCRCHCHFLPVALATAALRLGYLGAAYRVNKVVIVGLAAILSHSLLHLLELALLLGLLLLDLLGFLFVIL
ncbi:Uncharacterised protein [Segatella copri]|nr:Uncharacterised protein [Segatella copri]